MIRFEHAGSAYEVTSAPRSGSARSLRLDLLAARRLLAPLGGAARIRPLRALLAARWTGAAVSRMTDAEVIDDLVMRVATSRLHVYAEPVRRFSYRFDETAEVHEALEPLSAREVEEPPDDRIDAVAQALALRQAAQDGLAFCEECEKAQAEFEDLPPEPEPFASTDVAAQADALRQAAVDGVPFCEECERARREQAMPEQEQEEAAT
jgi:hypothetical protein